MAQVYAPRYCSLASCWMAILLAQGDTLLALPYRRRWYRRKGLPMARSSGACGGAGLAPWHGPPASSLVAARIQREQLPRRASPRTACGAGVNGTLSHTSHLLEGGTALAPMVVGFGTPWHTVAQV